MHAVRQLSPPPKECPNIRPKITDRRSSISGKPRTKCVFSATYRLTAFGSIMKFIHPVRHFMDRRNGPPPPTGAFAFNPRQCRMRYSRLHLVQALALALKHRYNGRPSRPGVRRRKSLPAFPRRYCRSVAQPGRAPSSGGGGRRFESSHSDHSGRKPDASYKRKRPLRLLTPGAVLRSGPSSASPALAMGGGAWRRRLLTRAGRNVSDRRAVIRRRPAYAPDSTRRRLPCSCRRHSRCGPVRPVW